MPRNIVGPTIEQLASEFNLIRKSRLEGVEGVYHFDSGKPGPVLGITIQTHGNEPSGLAVLWYFRNKFRIQERLVQGSVLFVANNIKAAERYFNVLKTADNPKKEELKRRTRFCDLNMNRLPKNVLRLRSNNYEIRRAQELRPIWAKFDVAFDIHSMSRESPPIIIACGGLQKDLIAGFPADIIITNIEKVQIDKPAVSFYGVRGKTRTLAIEAGNHENDSSFICAIACCTSLLQNLKMIAGKKKRASKDYLEYFVDGSVLFPNKSFELVKVFETFEPVCEGRILAHGNGVKIVAGFEGHTIMAPTTVKPVSIKEEVMFLTRPVRKLTV